MENLLYAVPVIGVVALVVALALKAWIGKQDERNFRLYSCRRNGFPWTRI